MTGMFNKQTVKDVEKPAGTQSIITSPCRVVVQNLTEISSPTFWVGKQGRFDFYLQARKQILSSRMQATEHKYGMSSTISSI